MDKVDLYPLDELARLLCPEGDKKAVYQTARRIQNWVTAGLLRPVGQVHGGRGVHRHYDRHELGKAAVLLELHRYQLPIRVLELVAGLFDDAREPDEDPESAKVRGPTPGQRRRQRKLARLMRSDWQRQRQVFLILNHPATGDLQVNVATEAALADGDRSRVVVNLTAILSALA